MNRLRLLPLVLCAALPLVSGCSDTEDFNEIPDEPAAPRGAGPAETSMTRADVRRLCADHVVVVINRKNRVWLNDETSSPEALPGELRKLGAAHPRRPVILVMQSGTRPDAAAFVKLHAARAGLGRVELR